MTLGRGFWKLWAGNASANLADGVVFISIPLLATALTSDAVLIAGLAAVYSAVRLLVVLPAGVYVDRFDRRSILWATNLARGILLAGAVSAFIAGQGSLVLLYGLYAFLGVLETVADNAALSILPDIVPAAQLDRANGRISAAQLTADEFVGPPLGGLLCALAVALPLAVTGGMYLAACVFFLALPRRQLSAPSRLQMVRSSVFREAVEGAAWLRGNRLLSGVAVVGGLASVAYMMPFSILVLYAQQVLGLGPSGYGVLLAFSALGGLVGSSVTAPLRSRIGYAWTITGSLALGCSALIGLSFTQSPWVAALLLAAYILHAVIWGICVNSIRQRLIPEQLRGRVNASSKVLGLIGLTLGALLGGLLANYFGTSAPFLAGGLIFGVCALAVWRLFRNSNPDTCEPALAGVAGGHPVDPS